MTKPRGVHITGNWEMYKTIQEGKEFVETLAPQIRSSQASVALAVPFTQIYLLSQLVLEKKYPLHIGAQNLSSEAEGAFTGEISAKMLKEAQASFVLVGHSERRRIFKESSSLIQKKIKQALNANLKVVLCIGETLEERKANLTEKVLQEQLLESLAGFSSDEIQTLMIAYEPVWAIGTGIVAKAEEAEVAHQFCRSVIEKKWGKERSSLIPIQYGGSVTPDNAKALLDMPSIDGLLVGGASLKPQTFSQIINSY